MRWNAGITLAQTRFYVVDGTIGSPGIGFTQESNCGLSRPSPAQVVMSTAGVERMRWHANGSTTTGDHYTTGITWISNGSNVAPSLACSNDNNTGLFWAGADMLGVTCGGVNVATFSASGLAVAGTITNTGGASFVIPVAVGDETTALAAGAAKVTFRMPKAMTLTAVRGSLTTAQTSGALLTFNVKENGATVFSTKPTFDNAEKTTTTAAAPPVLSDTTLADDAEITIDIDQVGDGTAKGLKVYLIGN